MLIGDVSKKYNVGIETLRYYDKIGLLIPERRKNNRYYTEEHIKRLKSIILMKNMLFTLDEIKDIMQIDEQIDRCLKENIVDKEAINRLFQGVSLKHTEILEKEKELKRVKVYLENIIEKIQDLKRRYCSE